MTIVAGFSASRQSSAPLHLATQLARCTGSRVVAVAIVERPWPPTSDPVEEECLSFMGAQALASLQRIVAELPHDVDVWQMVHQATSIPVGLTELAAEMNAEAVVIGSSSSGLLGRIALGSVTDRLVHTASVPVAVAPRGYLASPLRIERLTAAYGGQADSAGLIGTCADLSERWLARLRIAAFTVRPPAIFGGAIELPGEDLVFKEWALRTRDGIAAQLEKARVESANLDAEVVVGAGATWVAAVDAVGWTTGDMLVLGSGAAGPAAQVFLGSAAGRILRHAPVPTMIVPRPAV